VPRSGEFPGQPALAAVERCTFERRYAVENVLVPIASSEAIAEFECGGERIHDLPSISASMRTSISMSTSIRNS
jgi:hypothetical protein